MWKSGGSRTFSLGATGGSWFLVGGHSIGTTTTTTNYTMQVFGSDAYRVKFVEKYTKHAC